MAAGMSEDYSMAWIVQESYAAWWGGLGDGSGFFIDQTSDNPTALG